MIHSYLSTKLRAIRSANSSGELTPPVLASAYTVFFWVSVAITMSFAPVRWASVKSPINWLVTLKSFRTCWSALRSRWTRRTSALPY